MLVFRFDTSVLSLTLTASLFVLAALPAGAQSLDAKRQAEEIVDHMELVAEARRRMGLEAPSWHTLRRYEDKLADLLDEDNQKALLCGAVSMNAFMAAGFDGRVPTAGNDEDFPPGSLIDWLYHYSIPLIGMVVDRTLEYQAGMRETANECMRHRFVFVMLSDTPMHEIDIPAEEECLRGGECPHRENQDDWEEDWDED